MPTARTYLWAALGTPDSVPDRVEVTVCHLCYCLVPVCRLDEHHDYHVQLEKGRT